MSLLTVKEFLEKLPEGIMTESELSNICEEGCNYFNIYPNVQLDADLESDYLGFVIVKCSNGYVQIPFDNYDLLNGYEQYDTCEAKSIDEDIVRAYLEEYKRQYEFISTLVNNS